jgi:hypothetical protein
MKSVNSLIHYHIVVPGLALSLAVCPDAAVPRRRLELVRHISHPLPGKAIVHSEHRGLSSCGQVELVHIVPERQWARRAFIVDPLRAEVCIHSPLGRRYLSIGVAFLILVRR